MKKVLFFAAAIVAACTFTSCKKTCNCSEKVTGVSKTIETDGKTYKSCDDIEKDLQNASGSYGGIKWTCTQK